MRPIRVRMQAFGPYAGVCDLDFRDLGENRFFLIHGPTGAGKTTVLDAMCFALYGSTTGGERSAELMRSQFAESSVPTEVVFDFALGDARYRIRRRPQQERARLRGSGTVTDAAEVCLWRRDACADDADDGVVLATKAGEVKELIHEAVGFSVEQFRQVVMLPQGRFRELLAADSRTREGVLRTLFGTERYGAIEDELKQRRREVEAGLGRTRTQRAEVLAGLGADGDDALAGLTAEAEAGALRAAADRDAAKAAADAAARALEEGRAAVRLRAQEASALRALEDADRALAEAVSVRDAAESARVEAEGRAEERERLATALRTLEEAQASSGALREAQERAQEAARLHDAASASCDLGRSRVDALLARVEEIRERIALDGVAAAGLESATAALARAEELARRAGALADARERLASVERRRDEAAEAVEASEERAAEACAHRDALLAAWRDGRAAALAAGLADGTPCPVCGSLEHPAPAARAGAVPGDEEIDAAETASRASDEARDLARRAAAEAEQALEKLRGEVQALEREAPDADPQESRALCEAARERVAEARRAADGVAEREAARGEVERELAEAREELAGAEAELRSCVTRAGEAATALALAERDVPEAVRDERVLDEAIQHARAELRAFDERVDAVRRLAGEAVAALGAARATRDERAAALEAARTAALGAPEPDIDALERAARDATAARDHAVEAAARADAAVGRLREAAARVAAIDAEAGELDRRHDIVAAVADAACGRNTENLSFQRYVLGVFLTEVTQAATRRLAVMTGGRYRLHVAHGPRDRRSASGLDLEVFDEYTGEDRPVSTLSGGEGFLASLALALGLAEVVESFAGGVHLDTVFVDEGFGTLDEESLDTAIDALMALQGSGRLVGIISHVADLRQVIPARLEVTASPQGSTARFIVP